MSEVALNDTAMRAEESASRASVLRRLRVTDNVFRGVTRGSALFVLVILSGVILSLVIGSMPAIRRSEERL